MASFFRHCHAFLPVVAQSRHDLSLFEELRQQSSFLFTVILGISSRFVHRLDDNRSAPVQADASLAIRRLVYSHYAASLLRRDYSIRDVQAVLLMSGWGLHMGPGGPEAWVATGHCARLGHRLGLHQLGQGDQSTQVPEASLARLVNQWKTWLCLSS